MASSDRMLAQLFLHETDWPVLYQFPCHDFAKKVCRRRNAFSLPLFTPPTQKKVSEYARNQSQDIPPSSLENWRNRKNAGRPVVPLIEIVPYLVLGSQV